MEDVFVANGYDLYGKGVKQIRPTKNLLFIQGVSKKKVIQP